MPGNSSTPNLTFSENLAAKILTWSLGGTAGGSYYVADPWWSSWEDYFLSLAAILGVSPSSVVVARKLRAGPPSSLLFEFFLDHPKTARRSKILICRFRSRWWTSTKTTLGLLHLLQFRVGEQLKSEIFPVQPWLTSDASHLVT